MTTNSYGARSTLCVGDRSYTIFRLDALRDQGVDVCALPYPLRILLENLLRCEDGESVTAEDILALARWKPADAPSREISYMPARVLLQDFTGVPCVVDLAAMRDAVARMGGDPRRINPLQPVELVIDHSVQVDVAGSNRALKANVTREFERNRERYAFLKWGQQAFRNFRVVPPSTGIVHQVNVEHLARVVFTADGVAYPDTLVGTDSHTTMVNGLGVLGWGVGGIEAEAAMLGQPVSMLIPQVVGFRLTGELPDGATATDLVLTVTQMLRQHGVVGKFVEFGGPGLASLTLADRATIANMAPEYGATCGYCPVDAETLRYLRLTGRSEEQVNLVEAYTKEQGLFHEPGASSVAYSATLELDLGTVESSIAGPRRPQDRLPVRQASAAFHDALPSLLGPGAAADAPSVAVSLDGQQCELRHGSVVIAAITSCTNTSNPQVMLAAGLVARKAVERGLRCKPWVKTSLAPGSQVVTRYLDAAGLTPFLDQLGFQTVGYGCTTCIGNSGPLRSEVSDAIERGKLVVSSVLSGNRNFEGRVHQLVRANYLMSPPLVVAYALAGRVDIDLVNEPLGTDADGKPVFLRDVWPTQAEIRKTAESCVTASMFRESYADVFAGDENWAEVRCACGDRFEWDTESTYVKRAPYFDAMPREAPAEVADIRGARALVYLGDSITTDHISPAGAIKAASPAGEWLRGRGVAPADFNTYGSRRGHDDVMVRGTFANIRIRNRLAPGTEGGFTTYLPTGEVMSVFDAGVRYQQAGTPTVVLAGKEYGCGSSRDWAAKGPYLQGVRATIAESYERIHRSNLVGMGILPLQLAPGDSIESLGLTGREVFDIIGLTEGVRTGFANGRQVTVRATDDTGTVREFPATVRIDTPREVEYYRHGGILCYVLRQILSAS